MTKPEWGTRYKCFKCGAAFYDLNKPQPICPKCQADQTKAKPKSTPRSQKNAVPVVPDTDETADDDIDSINEPDAETIDDNFLDDDI